MKTEYGRYSGREIEAIEAKMNDPTSTVICPRCGKKLCFKDCTSACEVVCETIGCLHGAVRGI